MATDRLQKILARAGIASRRASEQLIVGGRVRVNGRVVTELGAKADPRRDRIEVDGSRIVAEAPIYLVLHKPRGVVSTMSDPEGRVSVKDFLKDAGGRVYPVGRLDYATSGVLLATNDGDFADGLLHPSREVPKVYVAKVAGVMRDGDLEAWRKGVRLEDGMTLPARVKLLRHEGDKTWIELMIREGRNQQIRRMGEATGFRVMRLARTAFAGVTSEGLRPGTWRPLTAEELAALKKEFGVPKRLPHVDVAHVSQAPRGPARRDTHARPSSQGGQAGPRYGGGAPGRRSYDVRSDWGGGAGRGHSGPSEDQESADDAGRGGIGRGGRGASSRTTGTGGGVGASRSGDYRMTRGRPRHGR
jgi:23S rRNA pseudouridine2605 synthase